MVASHTNTWTADSVKLKNEGSPNLYKDYSILKYGDAIKSDIDIDSLYFNYRLEAQEFGKDNWIGLLIILKKIIATRHAFDLIYMLVCAKFDIIYIINKSHI